MEEPLKAREPKWHLREKGAVPGSYWQKSTEDGYSTSGSKVLPKKLRETQTGKQGCECVKWTDRHNFLCCSVSCERMDIEYKKQIEAKR